MEFPREGPHNIDCDIPVSGSVILHSEAGGTSVRCCELLSGLKSVDGDEETEEALLQRVLNLNNTT